MRSRTVFGAVSGAAGMAVAIAMLAAGPARADEIPWVKSFQSAMSQAKASNKLVMADFYTDWWGWCKKLEAETYKDPRVIRLTGQVVPVKLNAEKGGQSVAQKYGVRGYPTILFINRAGEVEGKIGGYEPAEGFAQDLTRIVTAHRELPQLEAKHRAQPGNAAVSARLAAIYAGRGRAVQAQALLTSAAQHDPSNATGALAKGYNALGDYYAEQQAFERATPLFQTAARVAKTSDERIHANIGAASSLLSQRKLKASEPYLKAIVDEKSAPAELRARAQKMLTEVRKEAGGR